MQSTMSEYLLKGYLPFYLSFRSTIYDGLHFMVLAVAVLLLYATVDGFTQEIESSGMKIVDILDEIERVARWRGDGKQNPFGKLRKERANKIGGVS